MTVIKTRTVLLAEYWEQQPYKIYVVIMRCPRKLRKTDTKYIRVEAATDDYMPRARALRVALQESVTYSSSSKAILSIRLADPELDLGCTWGSDANNPLETVKTCYQCDAVTDYLFQDSRCCN